MNVMNVFLKSHYRYLSNQRKSFLRFPVTLWKFRVLFFYFRTFDSRVEIDAIHIGKIAISIASCLFLDLVRTNPEKIFTLRTHEMFHVHSTPEKFKNASINDGRKAYVHPWSHDNRHVIVSIHTKTQSRCFQIPPVWRAFSYQKLRFRWRNFSG